MNIRERIVKEAESWLNTPYLHQGFVKGRQGGVDCAMILVGVYQPLGLLPADLDPRPYPMQWHLHRSAERYLDWFTAHAREVAVPEVGDIALFKYGRTVSHSGIVAPNDVVIHAYREAGMVVRDELRMFADRFHSYWSVV